MDEKKIKLKVIYSCVELDIATLVFLECANNNDEKRDKTKIKNVFSETWLRCVSGAVLKGTEPIFTYTSTSNYN